MGEKVKSSLLSIVMGIIVAVGTVWIADLLELENQPPLIAMGIMLAYIAISAIIAIAAIRLVQEHINKQ